MRLRISSSRVALCVALLACGADSTPAVNPTPDITSLTPAIADQGSSDVSMVIAGSDFVKSSIIRADGADRPTQYVSGTELRTTLPSSDFAIARTMQISVFNPSPGGGTSSAATLTVRVRTNPLPIISSLTPQFVAAGSTTADVTIAGTGFVPQSHVFIGSSDRAVTYVSPTQLRITLSATELATGGTIVLRVVNASPGGGGSNTASLEVRTPVPTVTSLDQTQSTAGQAGLLLRVNGTAFVSSSVVSFNGAPRVTRVVAPGTLEATLLEGDLRAAGTFTIAVVNPAPGGGTSNALSFTLVNGAPEITLLPSRGASAGRSGFTLYVHGTRFVAGSVVWWNGVALPTQYVSGTRVSATVSTASVAQPGTAQITVVNPAPGGGTSSARTMTIRTVGATTSTNQLLVVTARDLAFDRSTSRLYASVASTSPTNGNSIVSIDPASGTMTNAVFVGSEPGTLALSDDGKNLYVGLNGANAVRRVELSSMSPGLQWSVGAGLVAADMVVLPGMPNTVAVSRHARGYSPPLEGVTIYDDGVARPTSSAGHTGAARLEALASSSVLYGYNNAHTGFEFFTVGVDAAGARHLTTTGGLVAGFDTDIVGAEGRIYGTDGSIVDPEQRVKIGSFGQTAEAIAIDAEMGRAYFLSGARLGVYDLNNYQLLGTVNLPQPSFDHPALSTTRVVRWGTDGVAFTDLTRVFLVRSPIIGP